MSAKFDWETDEEERRPQESLWDDPTASAGPPPAARRWNWRPAALVLVLALMAGAVIWWRVDRRIDANVQAITTDVVAGHNLVQRAVADGDEEVFRSALSGRMPDWTAGEVELFAEQLFYDRHPFGLSPTEGSLPIILSEPDDETLDEKSIYAVELSPDLNEAVVIVEHPYRVETSGETVLLRQTSLFRRGDSRWLLSPPLDEFWGDWVTSEGNHLSLIYPQRDEEIASRLAADLDAEIGRMCATLEDIDCSADLYLTVRLQTDPTSLSAMSIPLGPLQEAREQEDILELPTPTLVGLPVQEDEAQREAGYGALRDGYARHVLGAAIAQTVGWQCCDDALLFSLLLDYQLGELGLKTWPITPADHQRVLDRRIRMSDPANYLRARFRSEVAGDRLWELQAAIDFMIKGVPGSSAAGIQRKLDRTNTFSQLVDIVWISAAEESGGALPDNIDLAWWLFALDNANGAAEPLPLPSGEALYSSCSLMDGNLSSGNSSMYRYLIEEDRWSDVYNVQGMIWLTTLPAPDKLLLQEFGLEGQSFRPNTWQNGEARQILVPQFEASTISFGETDPAGERLVAYTLNQDTGDVSGLLVDLTTCTEGCVVAEMPGHPVWSPDGRSAVYMGGSDFFPNDLLVAGNDRYILMESPDASHEMSLTVGPGDATAESTEFFAAGVGRSPFWLDNQTFGYVRHIDTIDGTASGETEIVLATLGDITPTTLVTTSELSAQLPDDLSLRSLSIGFVATHPQNPGRLFIVGLDDVQRAYLIIYDLDTGAAEVRMQLLLTMSLSLGFSPDGRYVVMTGQDSNVAAPGEDAAILLVHNIEENRTIPLIPRLPFFLPAVVHDWSDDGRWLAIIMEDDLIGLVAPDSGDTRLLARSSGSCTSVAWVRE